MSSAAGSAAARAPAGESVHVRLRVAGESYAVAVEHVLEVAVLGEVAPVPGAAATVLGVRNLRGRVLPVFDLAAVLGLARAHPARRMLVVEHDGIRAAFAIDQVTDVGPLPEPAAEAVSPFLAGATLDGGTLVGVVDVPRLFRALAQEET